MIALKFERTMLVVGIVVATVVRGMFLVDEVAGVVLAEIERNAIAIRVSVSDGVESAPIALATLLRIVSTGVVEDKIILLIERVIE